MRPLIGILLLFTALGFTASATATDSSPSLKIAANSGTTSGQLDQGTSEPVLTPDALQALLPESLPGGFERTSAESGIKQGAPGAVGKYERSSGESDAAHEQLEILIYDIVARDNPRHYAVRERVLFQMEADSASETRETTLAGYPAFEEPLDELEQEMLVLVHERIVVEASSKSLGNEVLREVLSNLDWTRIAGLANGSHAE